MRANTFTLADGESAVIIRPNGTMSYVANTEYDIADPNIVRVVAALSRCEDDLEWMLDLEDWFADKMRESGFNPILIS